MPDEGDVVSKRDVLEQFERRRCNSIAASATPLGERVWFDDGGHCGVPGLVAGVLCKDDTYEWTALYEKSVTNKWVRFVAKRSFSGGEKF
jgi:hypothetical protein